MLNITSEGQLRVERLLKKLNCCILVDRFHSFYLLASTCNGSGLINFPSLECPCVNIMDYGQVSGIAEVEYEECCPISQILGQ